MFQRSSRRTKDAFSLSRRMVLAFTSKRAVSGSARIGSSNAPDESFFKNTSRRWIFNEQKRLEERYTRFDVRELKVVAANAMGGQPCTEIVKYVEGGFNKVFLARGSNRREVIIRIPDPIAGPPRYTTANEVATMNFLRNTLELPVPQVLAYSATSSNPVESEYIIMERIHGESLASRWLSLSAKELGEITIQLAKIEQKMFFFKFPGYGSLYHSCDIEGQPQIPLGVDDFCIGPISKRQFWHDERAEMLVDRGPWKSPVECITAGARRESAVLRKYAQPKPRTRFTLSTEYDIDPKEHISLLSQFEKLAPLLIPQGSNLSSPTLCHPDLSFSNILLVPGSTKIAGIIDWQDAAILPLLMQAGYPAFCEHDMSRPQTLKRPELPENFNSLTADEQLEAKAKLRHEEANYYYTAAMGLYSKEHFSALRTSSLRMRQYLIQQSQYPWDADLVNLQVALVGITSPGVWSTISSQECPLQFSNEERERAIAESAEWNGSEALLSQIRDDIGIDPEGGTEPENFERACRRNKEYRTEMLRHADINERENTWQNWPFEDDEDFSYSPDLP